MKARTSNHKPTHEQIAQRAYAIFEQSGRAPGHDEENWLRAERELTAAASKEETKPKNNGRIVAAQGPRTTTPAPGQQMATRA